MEFHRNFINLENNLSINKKNIVILVEHKVRELNSNIFLATKLIKKGFRVYIGNWLSVNRILTNFDKGFGIIFKGGIDDKMLKKVIEKCNAHIVIDQEAGPTKFVSGGIRSRINLLNTNNIDKYYTINYTRFLQAKKEITFKKKKVLNNFGWPRVDLWKKSNQYIYQTDIKNLKNKYDKYVLYVSNLRHTYIDYETGLDNFLSNNLLIYKQFNFSKNQIQTKISTLRKESIEKRSSFLSVINYLNYISKKNNMNVLIRPHFNDDIEGWKFFINKNPNLHLLNFENDLHPLIVGCDLFLHSGDASAYQAYLTNKKIGLIGIKKNNLKKINKNLLDMSIKIFNFNDLSHFLVKKTKKKNKEFLRYIKRHLNYDEKHDASEKICKDISGLRISNQSSIDFQFLTKVVFFIKDYFYVLKSFFYKKKTVKNPGGINSDEILSFITKIENKKIRKIKIRRIIRNLIEIDF